MANSGYSQSECLPGEHSNSLSLHSTGPDPNSSTSGPLTSGTVTTPTHASGSANSSGISAISSTSSSSSSSTLSSSSSTFSSSNSSTSTVIQINNVSITTASSSSGPIQNALNPPPQHKGIYQQQPLSNNANNQYCEPLARPASTHTPMTMPVVTPPPPLPASVSAPPHLNSGALPAFRTVHQGASQRGDFGLVNGFTFHTDNAQNTHINSGNSISNSVLSLAGYTDDMSDIFQCGKCKNQYYTVKSFVQHRSNHECTAQVQYSNLSDSKMHLNNVSINHNGTVVNHVNSINNSINSINGINNGMNNVNNINNGSLLPLESFSSLLNSTQLVSPSPFHNHQHQNLQNSQNVLHSHQNLPESSANSYLTDQSQCNSISNPGSILMHYDSQEKNIVYENVPLSSLNPSLDPRMVSPSISPSLLHLQGGDISSNTDDFSQYRLDDAELWSESLATDFNGIQFDQSQNAQNQQNILPQNSGDKNPQTVFVSTLINNFHSTSPASFANMVHDLSEQNGGQAHNSVNDSVNYYANSVNSGVKNSMNVQFVPVSSIENFKSSSSSVDKSPEDSSNTKDSNGVCREPEPVTVIHHQPDNSLKISGKARKNPGVKVQNKVQKGSKGSGKDSSAGVPSQDSSSSFICNNNPLNVVSPPNVTISSDCPLPKSSTISNKNNANTNSNSNVVSNNANSNISNSNNNSSVNAPGKQPKNSTGNGKRTPSKSVPPSTPEVAIRCEVCQLSFPRDREYQNHMLFHSGERKFHCLNCGKTFAKKSSLRKHIMTHKQLSVEEIDDLMTKCDANLQTKAKSGSQSAQQSQPQTSQSSQTPQVSSQQSQQTVTQTSQTVNKQPTTSEPNGNTNTVNITSIPVISSIDQSLPSSSSSSQDQKPTVNNSSVNISMNHSVANPTNNLQTIVTVKKEIKEESFEPVAKKSRLNIVKNAVILVDKVGNVVNFVSTNPNPVNKTANVVNNNTVGVNKNTTFSKIRLQCNFASCDKIFEASAMLKHIEDEHGFSIKEGVDVDDNDEPTVPQSSQGSSNEQSTEGESGSMATPSAKKFACPVCFIQFKTEKAMNDHQARASHKHECNVCLKIFLTDRAMKRHTRKHGEAPTPTCYLCSEMFDNCQDLRNHMATGHGNDVKNCCCDICDASFRDLEQLKSHQRAHDPTVLHPCPVDGCVKSFNAPEKLKSHILVHYGLKSFPCGFCRRSFTRQSTLTDHMKTHQKQEENCEDDRQFVDPMVKTEPADTNTETFTTLENAVPFPNASDSSNSSSLLSGPTIQSIMVPISNFQMFSTSAQQPETTPILYLYPCQKCHNTFLSQNDLDGHLCVAKSNYSEANSSSIINAT